eukprot:4706119-Pyramimonas_sp.AAC.1
MDVCLQPVIRTKDVRAVALGAGIARRVLNESTHFELTLQKYADLRFNDTRASQLESIPRILSNMVSEGVQEERLQKAMEQASYTL